MTIHIIPPIVSTPAIERELAELCLQLEHAERAHGAVALMVLLDATIEAVCGDNPALSDLKRLQIYRRAVTNLKRAGLR